MKNRKKEILLIALVFFLFIISSYLVGKYEAQITNLIIFKGLFGAILYIFLIIAAVVIAPFETLPLMPVAVVIWGPFLTGILFLIGSMAGSYIAFYLARKFGQKLICRLFNKCAINEFFFFTRNEHIFWVIVLARLILPVDIVSYAIGLFTEIKTMPYLLASFLGIAPFAFIFSFGAKLPIGFQIIAGVLLIMLFLLSYKKIKRFIGIK